MPLGDSRTPLFGARLDQRSDPDRSHLQRRFGQNGTWRTTRSPIGPALPRGILAYNEFDLRLGGTRRRLELPINAVTVLFLFEGSVCIESVPGGDARFTSLVRGSVDRAGIGRHDGRLSGVEILLEPWLAWRVFGIPMRELSEAPVALDALTGRRGLRVAEQLAEAADARRRMTILRRLLADRVREGPQVAPQVLWAWQRLVASRGQIRIADLATASEWTARTLENRFAEQIGQTPKRAARILRLRDAAAQLINGLVPSHVAASCGFADQAHLGREVKAMTGFTPARLGAQRAGGVGTEGPPLDRLDGQVTSLLLPVVGSGAVPVSTPSAR
ncbi:helix-turn-helix domain-containing protein [Catenulispora subtropica]|uniref:HTH araC/xylS-type domain-containing protein n=1 Tax=Catenulispora subtropica TaxID=450798 RepID=A0ABP5CEU9_9ACTN